MDERWQQFRWFEIRPAQNLKPATYVCPLCDGFLPALSEHMLLLPEGDASRRRHGAHRLRREGAQGGEAAVPRRVAEGSVLVAGVAPPPCVTTDGRQSAGIRSAGTSWSK